MDNPFDSDMVGDKIIRHLNEDEVMSIFFPRVGKSLIVDARHDLENGPAVLLDDMVASPEERLRSLRRLRPQFGKPGQLTLAPWFGGIRAFEERGVLETIVNRFHAMGFPDAADAATAALRTLRRTERELLLDLIAGNPRSTRTYWQRGK